jgi:hypothetical protein
MEEGSGLRVLRASDPQLLRALEGAVRLGVPVLLEGLGESLEPALEPLLLRQTYAQVGAGYLAVQSQACQHICAAGMIGRPFGWRPCWRSMGVAAPLVPPA